MRVQRINPKQKAVEELRRASMIYKTATRNGYNTAGILRKIEKLKSKLEGNQ